MRVSILLAGACAAALLTGCTMLNTPNGQEPTPSNLAAKSDLPAGPVAKRVPKTIEQVGRTRVDPYNWLKDDNWQEVMSDPSVLREDIREYLEAENAFTKTYLEDPTEALREELFEEMRGRIKEDDSSLPNIDGPYAYLVRYREGGEYPIFARKAASAVYDTDAPDKVLLDGDAMGEGEAYFSFGRVSHSPNHRYV
ncbi:MAG: S9 family peptidase, partial [Pseudomonadota bacterium]